MLTGLQVAATRLTATVYSLLHVELSLRHRCKLYSVIYRRQAGGWLSASAVCLASKLYLKIHVLQW